MLRRHRGGPRPDKQDVHLESDQLGDQIRKAFDPPECISVLHGNGLSVHIAEVIQGLPERGDVGLFGGRRFGGDQDADAGDSPSC
jgi:hypothetical protein